MSDGLVWESAAALRYSTFFRWTGWTLTWWHHHNTVVSRVLLLLLPYTNVHLPSLPYDSYSLLSPLQSATTALVLAIPTFPTHSHDSDTLSMDHTWYNLCDKITEKYIITRVSTYNLHYPSELGNTVNCGVKMWINYLPVKSKLISLVTSPILLNIRHPLLLLRRHQANYCWDRNCIISTEREDLQTSELVRQWSMCCQLSRPAIKL